MASSHSHRQAGSEAPVAGIFQAQDSLSKVSDSHPDLRKALKRPSAFFFPCLQKSSHPCSVKINAATLSYRTAPAKCQPIPAAGSTASPPQPPAATGVHNAHSDDLTPPGVELTNLNELYKRLMLNCGLRVAGAMALTAVPAFLLFKRPFARAFLIGSLGGLVGGWQLHRADMIIRNPRENADLVPKAASLGECADDIQREWAETAKRLARFNWSSRA